MKPDKPIVYNEFYLDAMTGGSSELPAPVTPEQHYLAHLAGMTVTLPHPIILRDKFLAKICGMDVNVPTYIPGQFPQKFAYYAKAAGQDVDVPQPITREEMYWFDYVSGQPTPSEHEYTGAVPVTFNADGTPLIDLLISGNEEHSGTPTPDNPIMPHGTGERTGNLFDSDVLLEAVGWKKHDNIYSGYSSALHSKFNSFDKCIPVDAAVANIKVMFKYENFNTPLFVVFWYTDGTSTQNSKNGKPGEWTVLSGQSNSNKTLKGIAFSYGTNDLVELKEIMLNTGATAKPYGYKLDISSANTTTPVYLGEVETTRKVKKLVLTGEENITSGHLEQNLFNIPVNDYLRAPIISLICTHYRAQQNANSWTDVSDKHACFYAGLTLEFKQLYIMDSSYSTVADFKSYLAAQYAAGTPVTVWYVLAEPETGIVNEPLMKIGDYADSLSMEQAGVQIPTANGSTTLDVETTVKPSEVYIKYRGEAVATLSTLSAEVSSPEATPENANPEETEETENGSEDVSLQHEFEAIE